MVHRNARVALGAFLLILIADFAEAFLFEPTADEWATWPPYCRARYASLAFSVRDTELLKQVSGAEMQQWRDALGPTFEHVHHYCFALTQYQRASAEFEPSPRGFLMTNALDDAKYIFDRVKVTDPLAPEVATLYAQIEYELGSIDKAKTVLNDAIKANPQSDRPYLVLASIMRKSGSLSDAINLLERANEMTAFKSPEVNYFLGLMYVDRRDYSAAEKCAERAYGLGYPLPGLRQKLQKAKTNAASSSRR